MGTGYTRNDSANNIADGNVINASDLDGEFDAVQAAFNGSTGHTHDGTTGEGPKIDTAGLADDAVTGAKIDSTTTITAAGFTGPLTGTASNAALLDNIDSTSFLRSDAADTKTSGDLSFSDNVKAKFGAGSDLQIYHDAGHSRIVDAGTGNLRIQADDLRLQSADGVNNYITADNGGAATLYHNALAKIATTATGVDVTGTVTADYFRPASNQTDPDDGSAYIYQQSGVGWDFAALNLKFSTGTSGNRAERMRINSSGNVGIGTSSPNTKFTVSGNANVTGNFYTPDFGYIGNSAGTFSGINTGFQTLSGGSGYLLAFTNGSERMRINSSGNVGIGNSTPGNFYAGANQLVVGDGSGDNGISLYGGTSGVNRIYFADGSSGAARYDGYIEYSHSSRKMLFGTAANTRMTIDSSGNIGIGTTSPSYKLDTIGTTNGSIVSRVGNLSTGSGSQAILQLGVGATAERYVNLNTNYTSQYFQTSGVSITTSYQDFDTQIFRNSSGAERMRINSSGNVGISTTSPSSKLHVNGSFRQTGATAPFEWTVNSGALDYYKLNAVGYADNLIIANSGGNVGIGGLPSQRLHIHGGAVQFTNTQNTYLQINTADTHLYTAAAHPLRFGTNSTERMRILSDGKLALGSSSAVEKLRVSGNVEVYNDDTDGYIWFHDQGTRSWSIGSDQSTGNFAITNVQGLASGHKLQIDSGGNLLLATTSADPIGANGGNGRLAVGPTANESALNYFNATGGACLKLGVQQNTSIVKFFRNTASVVQVGDISVTTTSTSYNESSDYRLKDNVVAMTGAIDRVKAMAPKRFNFIVDPDTTVDGFIAHEAATIVPEAVTGTHNEVDGDGNPVYQGIDKGKLVPPTLNLWSASAESCKVPPEPAEIVAFSVPFT